MATTIHGGQGHCSSPRLSDPLPHLQKVKTSKTITIAGVTESAKPDFAPKHAPSRLTLDAAQAHWHLDLLGRDEHDTNIRLIPHKGLKGGAVNGTFGADLERAEQFQSHGYGVYLQPNPGGTRANEVTAGIALFFEHDDMPKDEQLVVWIPLGLPKPTFQLDTGGKSIHQYFVLTRPIEIERWVALMERLIAHANSDRSCKGANRMMRMAGGWYIDRNGIATAQSQIINASCERYDAELFEELLPVISTSRPCGKTPKSTRAAKPKHIRQIVEALDHIPQRVEGSGTYAEYRNILWGLIDACSEAGYSKEAAIELMEDHSPSNQCGWDIRQVADSGSGHVGAGTFWWHAKQHGWRGRHA